MIKNWTATIGAPLEITVEKEDKTIDKLVLCVSILGVKLDFIDENGKAFYITEIDFRLVTKG